MFATKAYLALLLTLTVCQARPSVWIEEVPVWRIGRAPNVAFGFGSGFSSDIGGVRHSSGIGASYQSGEGQAIGSGYGSAGGDTYAQGVGIARAGPTYPRPQIQPIYNNFGSASSSAQNYGHGSSSAQSHSNVQYPVVRALPFFNTVVSSAQSARGYGGYGGYGSAVAAAEGNGGYGSAVSSAQNVNGGGDYGSAVSIAHNAGGVRAGIAETVQRRGGSVQQAGATTIDSPGLQAAHAHAINAGGYY